MKKVSVIITTYNSQKTILRTVSSVLQQEGIGTDFIIELLIVDDCSTDSTLEILEKNDLEYFSTGKNSGGPNKGRNIGLKKATGDFVCIMDHDDEWLPGKLKAQLEFSDLAPIISCGYTEIDGQSGIKRDYVNLPIQGRPYFFYPENQTFLDRLVRSHHGQVAYIGGLMFSSSLKNVHFEEKFSMVDFDWFLELFHCQASVEICKPLYIRYLTGSNLSYYENYRSNDYLHSLVTLEKYKAGYPKMVKKAVRRINGTMGRYYYKMERMKDARKYFRKSERNLKIISYYLTSFCGYKFVNRKYKVF